MLWHALCKYRLTQVCVAAGALGIFRAKYRAREAQLPSCERNRVLAGVARCIINGHDEKLGATTSLEGDHSQKIWSSAWQYHDWRSHGHSQKAACHQCSMLDIDKRQLISMRQAGTDNDPCNSVKGHSKLLQIAHGLAIHGSGGADRLLTSPLHICDMQKALLLEEIRGGNGSSLLSPACMRTTLNSLHHASPSGESTAAGGVAEGSGIPDNCQE